MYNFDIMPKFDEFKFWFIPVNHHTVDVYIKEDSVLNSSNNWNFYERVDLDEAFDKYSIPTNSAIWLSDWEMWTRRPESAVCGPSFYRVGEMDPSSAQFNYETLLVGAGMMRALGNFEHNPDLAKPRLESCLKWLESTDFYTCPGSSVYHDSEPGGLCKHSIRVAQMARDLSQTAYSNLVSVQDAVLVALVHDWCKIGTYESYMRNVKNEQTGQWEKVPSYKRKNRMMACFGHGVSSMYLAQKFFILSHEEALAIRWHQGRWNVCREEFNELQQANEQYPMVHLLQFADQLSITDYSSKLFNKTNEAN